MNFSVLADIAGCVGCALSLFLALSKWVNSRENFTISVIDYADFGGSTRFLLSIENKSHAPLTICKISFCGTDCELEPKKIRGDPNAWNGATTARFPLRVQPHDAAFVYTEFVGCEHSRLIADMFVTFQIQSIDHSVSKTVLLGNTAYYLNKKP